jgi:hypothetical protein
VVCWDPGQVESRGLEASLDLDPVENLDPALVAVAVPVDFEVAAAGSVAATVVSAAVTVVFAVAQAVQVG